MQLSIHKRYLRTNTQNTIVVNSTPYKSHIRRKCSNLEIYLLPLTDTVQLPVNGPCKSRYLAINVICTTVSSLNIQLYDCIAVFPRLHPNTTYMPNTDDTDYTDNRVVFIIFRNRLAFFLSIPRVHYGAEFSDWLMRVLWHRILRGRQQGTWLPLDRKLCPHPLQPFLTAFKLNCNQGNDSDSDSEVFISL